MCIDLVFGQRGVRSLHDDGMHRLTPLFIGYPKDCGLINVWVIFKHSLNLGRVNIHSGRNNHVLLAITDIDVSIGVAIRDVTHRLVTVLLIGHVFIVLFVIVGKHRRATDKQFARVFWTNSCYLIAVIIKQLDVNEGRWLAARSRLAQLVFWQ